MIAVAIGLGIFVFLLVASFTDEMVFHTKGVGAFPGLVLGIWAAWPFFHQARVERYNFLHPVPREYKVPVPQAFGKVRDLLAELSYNFGDKWHVVTADPKIKRIVANLRFIDKETKLDLDARGGVHTREERLQRFLELEVQMKETAQGNTIVQLDFHPKVEGVNFAACDSIVSGLCNAVESALGPGTDAGSAADKKLPAPPWWLVGISALAVLSFMGDVGKRMSGAMDHIWTNPGKLDSEKKGRNDQLKQTQDELDAWQRFKEANHLQ